MTEKQQNTFNEFKKLIAILEKENIWYSLTLGTLLGSWKFNGFIPWDDDIDILIKRNDLIKLKELYPENVLTNEDKGYPLLLPKWVPNKADMNTSPIFIDLFTLVKTDEQRIKKWQSFGNKLRFGVYATHNNYKPHTFALKVLKFVTWPLVPFFRKNVDYFKEIERMDYPEGNRWYYAVNPVQTNDWSLLPPFFTDELVEAEFEGLKVNRVKVYKEWLEYRYKGINMTPPIGKKIEEHISAHSVRHIIYNPDTSDNGVDNDK